MWLFPGSRYYSCLKEYKSFYPINSFPPLPTSKTSPTDSLRKGARLFLSHTLFDNRLDTVDINEKRIQTTQKQTISQDGSPNNATKSYGQA